MLIKRSGNREARKKCKHIVVASHVYSIVFQLIIKELLIFDV